MDGLNLGLAINIADGASVNANKINSALEKLINLAENLTKNAKTTGSSVDKMGRDLLTAGNDANKSSNAVNHFGNTLHHNQHELVNFRAGVIRLFPYVTVLGGVYVIERAIKRMLERVRDVEEGMVKIQNATNYSNSEMAMLNQQWNDMSTHGVVSMDKIVDSAYDLTSMMPIAVDKVKGLTQAVVDYSQATQSSMQENGVTILRLAAQYGRPITDVTEMFDQMAMALNRTSIRANRITEELKLVGTEASTMKVPFNELLAILGRTDLYYGAEGATRLRMLFQMLSQNLPYHTKMLQQYGLTFSDLDIKTHGFFNVMKKLQGIPYGDVSRLVGGYSAGLLVRLSSAKDLARMASDADLFTPENTKGRVSGMNEAYLNSFPGQLKNVKNRWDSFMRSIGATSEGPIIDTLKAVGAFITKLDVAFANSRAGWMAVWTSMTGIASSIFGTVGKMFESVLRFAGLVSDSQEEARSNMQNHLIPFLVFIEEVKIQLREFFTGFLEGAWSAFSGGLAAAKPFVSLLGTLVDVIFPTAETRARSFGHALGGTIVIYEEVRMGIKLLTGAVGLLNAALYASPYVWLGVAAMAVGATLGFVAEKVIFYWQNVKNFFAGNI